MKEAEFNRTLKRLAHEIVEHYDDFSDVAIVGIRTRGEYLAKKIHRFIKFFKTILFSTSLTSAYSSGSCLINDLILSHASKLCGYTGKITHTLFFLSA